MGVAQKKKTVAKKKKAAVGKKTKAVKKSPAKAPKTAAADWRSELLGRIRGIMETAAPEAIEELKWRGVPVWSQSGMICTGETYKTHVKMTFAKGASLPDPSNLFNSSLEGNTRRAIDFHEGDKINEAALKTLIRAAVSLNLSKKR